MVLCPAPVRCIIQKLLPSAGILRQLIKSWVHLRRSSPLADRLRLGGSDPTTTTRGNMEGKELKKLCGPQLKPKRQATRIITGWRATKNGVAAGRTPWPQKGFVQGPSGLNLDVYLVGRGWVELYMVRHGADPLRSPHGASTY